MRTRVLALALMVTLTATAAWCGGCTAPVIVPPTPTPTPTPTPDPEPTPTPTPDPLPDTRPSVKLGEPLAFYVAEWGEPFDQYDPPAEEVTLVAGWEVGEWNVWIRFGSDDLSYDVEVR